jgi:phage baseplate assembly protein V
MSALLFAAFEAQLAAMRAENLALHAIVRETREQLTYHVAETNRRIAALVQVGTVTSFDPQKGAVLDVGYATHSVPYGMHSGTGVDWQPLKKGQQVTLLCPSGEVSNGFVIPGGYHDQNPQPSSDAGTDIRAQRGDAKKPNRLRTTDKGSYLEGLGNAVAVEDGKVTITADKIILKGTVYLGGSDADKPVAMKGTIDTGGYADTDNLATKAYVK